MAGIEPATDGLRNHLQHCATEAQTGMTAA